MRGKCLELRKVSFCIRNYRFQKWERSFMKSNLPRGSVFYDWFVCFKIRRLRTVLIDWCVFSFFKSYHYLAGGAYKF